MIGTDHHLSAVYCTWCKHTILSIIIPQRIATAFSPSGSRYSQSRRLIKANTLGHVAHFLEDLLAHTLSHQLQQSVSHSTVYWQSAESA